MHTASLEELLEPLEPAWPATVISQRKKITARKRRKFVRTIRRLGRKRGRPIRIHWR